MTPNATKAQELYGQLAGRSIETLTAWVEANHRVLRDLAELSASATQEAIRLSGELHSTALEAIQGPTLRLVEGQAEALGRSAERLSATAERTGRDIQEAITGLVNRLGALSTPA
jgi:hypothetical protein